MSERCALSDLPPEQCACRIHATPDDDPPPLGHPRPALFDGRCPACDGRIHEGDLIVRTGDGDYIHEECQ